MATHCRSGQGPASHRLKVGSSAQQNCFAWLHLCAVPVTQGTEVKAVAEDPTALECLSVPDTYHILLQGAKGKAAIAEELLPVEVKLVASSFGTMLLRR